MSVALLMKVATMGATYHQKLADLILGYHIDVGRTHSQRPPQEALIATSQAECSVLRLIHMFARGPSIKDVRKK